MKKLIRHQLFDCHHLANGISGAVCFSTGGNQPVSVNHMLGNWDFNLKVKKLVVGGSRIMLAILQMKIIYSLLIVNIPL